MVEIPSEFRAHLDSYRGPLDLLLFLIKREEIDIFDIPIAKIVEQYQIYLEILRDVDPNLCGEFLVVAAHLMEIKSKLLLPREELSEEEEMEDPRLELVRQLLEYKKYKERALILQRHLGDRSRRHERPFVELEQEDLGEAGPVELGSVSIWDLFTAFHRIQLAIGAREPHRIVNADRPIEEYVESVKEILRSAPARTARFEELFAGAASREEAIGLFLAVLEMAKAFLLLVFQDELFGPIEVRLREDREVERLIAEVAEEPSAEVDPAERFLREGEGKQAALEPLEEGPGASGTTRESEGEAFRAGSDSQ